jgi:hypothetical protein
MGQKKSHKNNRGNEKQFVDNFMCKTIMGVKKSKTGTTVNEEGIFWVITKKLNP